jgi:4-amino-4-deoxy-L-arabinose transferase-like glycosyltransferase
MYSFYALALLSVWGAIALRRRHTVPVFPLLVPPVMVLFTVITIYASTRFRASAEVSLCLLAAIAIDGAITFAAGRRSGRASTPQVQGTAI